MISCFGPLAEGLTERLPVGLHAIVVDQTAITHAYREAMRRRERGEAFYLLILTNDRRVTVCNTVANAINRAFTDPDERFIAAQNLAKGDLAVDGSTASAQWVHPELTDPFAGSTRELANLSDELLVRSHTEYSRLLSLGCSPKRFRRIFLPSTVPVFEPQPATEASVAVWLGNRPEYELTLALIALEQFRGNVTYLAPVPIPNMRARCVSAQSPEGRDALARASCIVCVDSSDPGDAVAFAKRGKNVVAPIASGAHEFVYGIVPWDSGSAPALLTCVAIAMGRDPSSEGPDEVPLMPPRPVLPANDAELPLVTIITATYNRRDYLRTMLGCIAAQSYPRIESIVVNDAGEPVDDIVAEFPFSRVIDAPTNGGTLAAAKLGLDAARGEYIGLLPDDDWIYPDHVERIMAAILRSGATWGHGLSMLRFLKRMPDGSMQTYGFNGSAYAATVESMTAQIGTPIAGHQCLQRKDTFDPADVGWYMTDSIVADQEYHMRLLDRYSPVMVERHTCEFRDHPANTGRTHNWAEAMRQIYENVRPLLHRPQVMHLRNRTLKGLRDVPVGQNVNKPTFEW